MFTWRWIIVWIWLAIFSISCGLVAGEAYHKVRYTGCTTFIPWQTLTPELAAQLEIVETP